MPSETTIYLVRHAHAEWREDAERPLSNEGLRAAGRVADYLAKRPIVAVYTSPSRRAIETVEPLANRLGLRADVTPDLRERALPVVRRDEFDALVARAWRSPGDAPSGGESNAAAQARGVAVLRTAVMRHVGTHVVLGTHGNLLALVLNGLDERFGYEFWRRLSFPDIYQLVFDGTRLSGVERLWDAD